MERKIPGFQDIPGVQERIRGFPWISIGNAVSMSREGDVPKPRRGYDVWTESEELCPWNLTKPYKATVLIVLII